MGARVEMGLVKAKSRKPVPENWRTLDLKKQVNTVQSLQILHITI